MNTPVFTSSLLSDCRAARDRRQTLHETASDKTASLTERIAKLQA